MSTFEDRKNRFESKFANDQELKFKVEAKRNRKVGLWAAEKLGKTADEAAAYAKDVQKADFEEAGDEDVFRKLRADLPKGDVSDDDIRQAMSEALAEAMDEVQNG
ncbi:DUF1476 domain-containing protein [Parvularcula sp. ZS-1/3]|uniref:DUF1476 domain-containing protein n=1 Tax=Parvularcula mediterranea TaxID=2732508 RepID=A0A7Y3RMF0_9PROT|nr:DUF1476 domain-containing protein [Parvularcula mediterranea]NNU16256.1 DUF1476 domain-containing protein [Parvularcula mediterranea]